MYCFLKTVCRLIYSLHSVAVSNSENIDLKKSSCFLQLTSQRWIPRTARKTSEKSWFLCWLIVSSGTLNNATAASPRASGPSSGLAWRTSGIPTSWWSLPRMSLIPSSLPSCRPQLLQECDGSSPPSAAAAAASAHRLSTALFQWFLPHFFFYFGSFCL